MTTDFTDYSDIVPEGTIAIVQLGVRLGDASDGLKRTKDGTGEGLDAEFTIVEGPHARRKFFAFLLVTGSTDGQKQMADRNKATLKKIVELGAFSGARRQEPGSAREADDGVARLRRVAFPRRDRNRARQKRISG